MMRFRFNTAQIIKMALGDAAEFMQSQIDGLTPTFDWKDTPEIRDLRVRRVIYLALRDRLNSRTVSCGRRVSRRRNPRSNGR